MSDQHHELWLSIFLSALESDPFARADWRDNDDWRDLHSWYLALTDAAVMACWGLMDAASGEIAAEGHPDSQGRERYLDLDVVGYEGWNPPTVTVAIEERGRPAGAAWNLLSVHAQLRVLIAHSRPHQYFPDSLEAVEPEIRGLMSRAYSGKSLLLVVCDIDSFPEAWPKVFSSKLLRLTTH